MKRGPRRAARSLVTVTAVVITAFTALTLYDMLRDHPGELVLTALGAALMALGLARGPTSTLGVDQLWWYLSLTGFCLVMAVLIHLERTLVAVLLTMALSVGCGLAWALVIQCRRPQTSTDAPSSMSCSELVCRRSS